MYSYGYDACACVYKDKYMYMYEYLCLYYVSKKGLGVTGANHGNGTVITK
jgi:hypothetical protein